MSIDGLLFQWTSTSTKVPHHHLIEYDIHVAENYRVGIKQQSLTHSILVDCNSLIGINCEEPFQSSRCSDWYTFQSLFGTIWKLKKSVVIMITAMFNGDEVWKLLRGRWHQWSYLTEAKTMSRENYFWMNISQNSKASIIPRSWKSYM